MSNLVVSTRDGKVRTGVTENTVEELAEIIEGYLVDGYAITDLVIEGVTE